MGHGVPAEARARAADFRKLPPVSHMQRVGWRGRGRGRGRGKRELPWPFFPSFFLAFIIMVSLFSSILGRGCWLSSTKILQQGGGDFIRKLSSPPFYSWQIRKRRGGGKKAIAAAAVLSFFFFFFSQTPARSNEGAAWSSNKMYVYSINPVFTQGW